MNLPTVSRISDAYSLNPEEHSSIGPGTYDYLSARGVLDEALAMGVFSVMVPRGEMIVIPYEGGGVRVRPLFKLDGGKFRQPANTGSLIYTMKDTVTANGPLCIGEGEAKALALSKDGHETIGIGGISNWSRKGDRSLLPALRERVWIGRTTRVAFDADWTIRKDIRRELELFTKRLKEAGALVQWAWLPLDLKGADDYTSTGKAIQWIDPGSNLRHAWRTDDRKWLNDRTHAPKIVERLGAKWNEDEHCFKGQTKNGNVFRLFVASSHKKVQAYKREGLFITTRDPEVKAATRGDGVGDFVAAFLLVHGMPAHWAKPLKRKTKRKGKLTAATVIRECLNNGWGWKQTSSTLRTLGLSADRSNFYRARRAIGLKKRSEGNFFSSSVPSIVKSHSAPASPSALGLSLNKDRSDQSRELVAKKGVTDWPVVKRAHWPVVKREQGENNHSSQPRACDRCGEEIRTTSKRLSRRRKCDPCLDFLMQGGPVGFTSSRVRWGY